nr:hypothetical protein [Tanacetum cinerariifolium]
MLLAQAQEAEVLLDEEQQDFLADSLQETNDCEDLQLQATTKFKADQVDAYDSDCDDEATTNAIFMANLSYCTTGKRVKDSEWFKEKMLLAQAQEAEVVLDEEQQDFLSDSLEETNDCEDLQLQATTKFKADQVDAYDSDCDDEATTNAIFMANLSYVGSLNDDMVAPHYDSDTLS